MTNDVTAPMSLEEFRERFLDKIQEVTGFNDMMMIDIRNSYTLDAVNEFYDENIEPEDAAEEEMSYWEDE